MAIATGQITIIDYNDALTLTGFISSNHPKIQQFNPDNGVYSPDWTSVNLVLTPSLFILGTGTDIIATASVTSITWADALVPGTPLTNNTDYAIGASGAKALTVKTNKLAGLSGKEYICTINYLDASTGLTLVYKSSISIGRVVNGGGIVDAIGMATQGNIFKNGAAVSLPAYVELWRGSVIDTTLVTYQWFMQDPTITSGSGALYDATVGAGWRKLADIAGQYTGCTSNTMTLFNVAVANYAVLKIQVKDTDSGSNTYNKYFYDTLTFVDQSDVIQISVTSSGGSVFKNGVGTSTLTAKVFRAGAEIDVGATTYTYKWYQYDSSGVLNPNFGGAGINFKTGKTLAVGDADVTVKATFVAEIS